MAVNTDYALVGRIIDALRRAGSWRGETHIQKCAFIAQAVFGVALSHRFVLYKHGPYSFELNSLLTSMRADQLVRLAPQPPYGPTYELTSRIGPIMQRFRHEIDAASPGIEAVAAFLDRKAVEELERVATAIYVWQRNPDLASAGRAEELARLKPHVPIENALAAVTEADQFLREAGHLRPN